MADFGKLNFSTSFNPTSAFPLDARCYFTDLASAQAAAVSAKEVGSTDTVYYFGMKLFVDDGITATWYVIQRDGTLLKENSVDDSVIQQIITQRLSRFFVIGPTEPENGPCLWYDTSHVITPSDPYYLALDRLSDNVDVTIDIGDDGYSVLNTAIPVIGDDGDSIIITVTN